MLGGDRLAFMNHHGLDKNRNYVTGENMSKPEPVLYTLVCGGMSARGSVVKNSRGVEMVSLDYFDRTKPPPRTDEIDIATDPRIYFACNITRRKVAGGHGVIRFTKFGEGVDCPIPLISPKPVYYPKSRLAWASGEKRYPYYPIP